MSALPPKTIMLGNPPNPHHQPSKADIAEWMEGAAAATEVLARLAADLAASVASVPASTLAEVQSAADDIVASATAAAEAAKARAETARDAAEDAAQYDYLLDDDQALIALTGMVTDERAFVRETDHVHKFDGTDWIDLGEGPTAAKLNASVYEAHFSEVSDGGGFLRVWVDSLRNILGGFDTAGKMVVDLSDKSHVPSGALDQGVRDRLLSGATSAEVSLDSGWLCVWKDEAGSIIGGFDASGKFVADLSDRTVMPASEGDDLAPGFALNSGPDITASGDSMTVGAGVQNYDNRYPQYLAALTGRAVHNLGVGGEGSRTIAARLGAVPAMVTVTGDTIPATTDPVVVTLAGMDDGGDVRPLLQGSAGVNPCQIAGVTGTLSEAGGGYSFSRSEAGDSVAVPWPVPFIPDGRNRLGDILIMWWGQNDGGSDASRVIARQQATIEEMTALNKRWLVVGLPSGDDSLRAGMDQQFIDAFGRRFVNVRKHLATVAALDARGITPSQTDLDQIALGRVPESLRADGTHFNDDGYILTAELIHQRLTELKFLEG